MMRQKLMIEDWVCHKDYPSIPIRVCGISKILSFEHSLLWDEDKSKYVRIERYSECDYDEIRPIPITPEILENNGFIEINDDEKWYKMQLLEENDFVGLVKFEDCGWVFSAVVFPNLINRLSIKYVHELQHALKLCEIEKSIEL